MACVSEPSLIDPAICETPCNPAADCGLINSFRGGDGLGWLRNNFSHVDDACDDVDRAANGVDQLMPGNLNYFDEAPLYRTVGAARVDEMATRVLRGLIGAGINTDTTGHLVSTDTTGHLIHSGGSSSTGSAGVVNSDTDPQIESLDTTGVLSSDDAHDMVHFEDSWPGSDGR